MKLWMALLIFFVADLLLAFSIYIILWKVVAKRIANRMARTVAFDLVDNNEAFKHGIPLISGLLPYELADIANQMGQQFDIMNDKFRSEDERRIAIENYKKLMTKYSLTYNKYQTNKL